MSRVCKRGVSSPATTCSSTLDQLGSIYKVTMLELIAFIMSYLTTGTHGGGFNIAGNLNSAWWKDNESGVASGYMMSEWRDDIFNKVIGQIVGALNAIRTESQTNASKVMWLIIACVGFLLAMGLKLVLDYFNKKKQDKVRLELRREDHVLQRV